MSGFCEKSGSGAFAWSRRHGPSQGDGVTDEGVYEGVHDGRRCGCGLKNGYFCSVSLD